MKLLLLAQPLFCYRKWFSRPPDSFLCFVFTRCRYAESLPAGDALSRQVDRRDAAELFDVLITQALRRIQRPQPMSPDPTQPPDSGTRRLIVLDALDECYHGDRDVLCQLINKFELTSPDWLYLLVTARDDNDDRQLVSRLNNAHKVHSSYNPFVTN